MFTDSLILMVNSGYAYMGYRMMDYGIPFIAAFDKETGNQKFFSVFNVKDDPIIGFRIIGSELLLLFKHRLEKYSLASGEKIITKEIAVEENGELKFFTGNRAFAKNGNGDFFNLAASDTTKLFVSTDKITLVMDEQCNVTDTLNNKDLWVNHLNLAGHRLITNDTVTYVINDQGKPVAEIEAGNHAFILGNQLYDRKEASFIAVELKEIIGL